MADDKAAPAQASGTAAASGDKKTEPRKIAGNLAYIPNHGRIKPVLEKISSAAKPDKLTQDYLANVFNLPIGSYKSVLPILRRVGFLGSDGTPTELYSRFRSDEGRSDAAFAALKNGFQELFKRSEHIYAAPESKLTDLITEVTGLTKSDPIVAAIRGTFKAFSSYLPQGFTSAQVGQHVVNAKAEIESEDTSERVERQPGGGVPLGLSYNINIVLPETKDPDVLNAIFKSLRDNLLRS